MSQENVDAFKRGIEAANRRDVDALLEELDPEVEWHPAILTGLGGEAAVYRGHEGFRQATRDVYEALGETHQDVPEIRDLGRRPHRRDRTRPRPWQGEQGRDRLAPCLRGRLQERQGDPASELPRSSRSPRSRRAQGVGDVAGERGRTVRRGIDAWNQRRPPRRVAGWLPPRKRELHW